MGFKPKDIVALIALIGSFILIGLGINTLVGYVVIAVIAYYFGSCKLGSVIETGKNKIEKGGKNDVE